MAGNRTGASIAAMEKVRIGGDKQWVVMRGRDVRKPVLLWLAGGPGGSELGWVRKFNSELEDHNLLSDGILRVMRVLARRSGQPLAKWARDKDLAHYLGSVSSVVTSLG